MKIYPFSLQEEIASEKLLIYGASIGGEILLSLLKKNQVTVWGVCDRFKYDWDFCGYTVMKPEDALKEERLSVLVTGTRAFNSIIQFLEAYPNIKVYEISDFIQNHDISSEEISFDKLAVEDYKKKYQYYVDEYQKDDEIILPTFDLTISEVCNLRCKDCSALVPYLSKRNTYPAEDIIEDFKKIGKVVDRIIELVIVGGEPFLYKELDKLLDFFQAQEYIDEISVVSNGTLFPSEAAIKALQLDKVRVRISDYDLETQKINELKEFFEEHHINYYIQKLDFWLDMGQPVKRNYAPIELAQLFRDCAFSKSQGMLDGRIYRCLHAAEIGKLNGVEIKENEDYIEIRNSNKSQDELKKDLKHYLFDIDSIVLCDYCSGAKNNIQPAVQLEKE